MAQDPLAPTMPLYTCNGTFITDSTMYKVIREEYFKLVPMEDHIDFKFVDQETGELLYNYQLAERNATLVSFKNKKCILELIFKESDSKIHKIHWFSYNAFNPDQVILDNLIETIDRIKPTGKVTIKLLGGIYEDVTLPLADSSAFNILLLIDDIRRIKEHPYDIMVIKDVGDP